MRFFNYSSYFLIVKLQIILIVIEVRSEKDRNGSSIEISDSHAESTTISSNYTDLTETTTVNSIHNYTQLTEDDEGFGEPRSSRSGGKGKRKKSGGDFKKYGKEFNKYGKEFQKFTDPNRKPECKALNDICANPLPDYGDGISRDLACCLPYCCKDFKCTDPSGTGEIVSPVVKDTGAGEAVAGTPLGKVISAPTAAQFAAGGAGLPGGGFPGAGFPGAGFPGAGGGFPGDGGAGFPGADGLPKVDGGKKGKRNRKSKSGELPVVDEEGEAEGEGGILGQLI